MFAKIVTDFGLAQNKLRHKIHESRFAVAARRSNWVVYISRGHAFRRGHALSSSTSHTAYPSVHAVDHENDPAIFSGEPQIPQDGMEQENYKSSDDRNIEENPDKDQDLTNNLARPREQAEIFAQPKPARGPSSKLESNGVMQPLDPVIQQKRKHTTALPDASCTGLDGTPLATEVENRVSDEREYEEYYKHRKASPLAEIEVADTRKPINQAADMTAGSEEYGGGEGDVVVWKVEQLDTAEEALLRAAEIWKRNAMEGDPNAPQSKVLRALRGERR